MFDPFENRISRDIRNRLSRIFLLALRARDGLGLEKQALALGDHVFDPDIQAFLKERLARYQGVMSRLPLDGSPPPYEIAHLLWDQGLFFECHEWLEPLWAAAQGREKKGIQALIRAAGAQVLAEAKKKAAARSSAKKALELIQMFKAQIPAPFDPGRLAQDLACLAQSPGKDQKKKADPDPDPAP